MSTPYSLETGKTSPNRSRRTSRKIRRIVIHHWDDPAKRPTFDGTVRWLLRDATDASIHYVVEAGRVARLVPEKDVAWHARGGNEDSIGIEINPRQHDGDYETAAALIREIRRRHGDLPLVRHRAVKGSSTSCPGTFDLGRLDHLARAGAGAPVSVPAGGTSAPAPARPAGAGRLKVDGRLGRETAKALQRFLNSRVTTRRLKIDGRLGPDTYRSLQEYLGAPYVDGEISRQSYRHDALGNGISPNGWEYTGAGSRGSQTIELLQTWIGARVDGILGAGSIAALQRRLNDHAVGM